MATTREESVMTALSELQELESDRIAAEQAETERQAAAREQERAEAEARRKAETEHLTRVAEAEARLRIESEEKARMADSDRRIEAMRAELLTIQRDREEMHLRVQSMAALDAPPPKRSRGWMAAFGAATVVAAGLGALLMLQQPTVQTVYVPTPAPDVAEVVDAPPAPPAVLEAPEAPAPAADPAPAAPTRPTRTQVRPTAPHRPAQDDPFANFEACGDDPTCGITSMGGSR